MTDAEVTIYIRSLLSEATAAYWTDAEITLYKKIAMSIVLGQFSYLLYPLKKKFTSGDLTINSPYVDLPADFYKIGKMEKASDGSMLRHIQEDEVIFFQTLTSDPCAWTYSDNHFMLIPTPTAGATAWLNIWYLPKLDTIAGFPDILHPLIGVESVINGKTKDEDTKDDIYLLQKRYYDAAVSDLATYQLQEAEAMRPYCMDDLYSSY
jgi:hypothetical protein